jgi:hypothetical protein
MLPSLLGSMPYFDSIPACCALPVSTLSGSSLEAWLAWSCWPWLRSSCRIWFLVDIHDFFLTMFWMERTGDVITRWRRAGP